MSFLPNEFAVYSRAASVSRDRYLINVKLISLRRHGSVGHHITVFINKLQSHSIIGMKYTENQGSTFEVRELYPGWLFDSIHIMYFKLKSK